MAMEVMEPFLSKEVQNEAEVRGSIPVSANNWGKNTAAWPYSLSSLSIGPLWSSCVPCSSKSSFLVRSWYSSAVIVTHSKIIPFSVRPVGYCRLPCRRRINGTTSGDDNFWIQPHLRRLKELPRSISPLGLRPRVGASPPVGVGLPYVHVDLLDLGWEAVSNYRILKLACVPRVIRNPHDACWLINHVALPWFQNLSYGRYITSVRMLVVLLCARNQIISCYLWCSHRDR